MSQEKELRMAVARFRGFRSHLYGSITASVVLEYHSIIRTLEVASKVDLKDFSIPSSYMLPRVMREREIIRHKSDTGPRLSAETYCDAREFKEKSDGLWRLTEKLEQSALVV